ncbi:MAG: DUF47 family protein [Saccharofermentanales bacterium]
MFGKKKKTDYFELLKDMTTYTMEAAKFLAQTMEDYNPQELGEALEKMHQIEHSADIALHDLNRRLAREFITPIDRQDIFSIANMIDDVTDSIEDVLMRLYMFNIRELRDEAHEFCKIIIDASEAIAAIMHEFGSFRKSNDIKRYIIEVNDLEEAGDAVYVRCIRRLYEQNDDPVDIIAWTEIFRRLESCCDDFEAVSQTVEHVIMKNT